MLGITFFCKPQLLQTIKVKWIGPVWMRIKFQLQISDTCGAQCSRNLTVLA
jgi:hypothetical protein